MMAHGLTEREYLANQAAMVMSIRADFYVCRVGIAIYWKVKSWNQNQTNWYLRLQIAARNLIC